MSHVKDIVEPAFAELKSHETADFAKRTAGILDTALGLSPALNIVRDRLSQRSLLSRYYDDIIGAQISRIATIVVLRLAQEAGG